MTVQVLGTRVTTVEKRNSVHFLQAILERHRRGMLVVPLEAGAETSIPGLQIVEHVACCAGGGWFTDRIEPRHDSAVAQIVLTSGTTGRPKPMLLSHRALGDVACRLIEIMNLDDSVREYVGAPVTYSFGFARIRAVAAVGGASFLPERGFRVDEFAAMLQRGEVNALSAVPTLLRLVLDQRERFKQVGRELRWLEIGSQAMARAEKEAVRTLFPNARIVQHYGLTEASRSTFLAISDEDAALDSVGRPNGRVEVDVTPEGLIAIRGPHLADGIIAADGVQPITDADGWLVTQDLGHRDNGCLYFGGRADDLINVGGIKVRADLFEERVRVHVGTRVAVAAAPGDDPLRGQIVVVAHEPLNDAATEEALKGVLATVASELGIGNGFALLPVEAIPRTDTNKIRRREITNRFDRSRQAQLTKSSRSKELNASEGVVETFVAVFGDSARNENASFRSLGGDSLHYVTMLTGLERYLPDMPEDWDMMSVGTLSALAARQSGRVTAGDADKSRTLPTNLDSVRGLACVLVVALHVVGVGSTDGLKIEAGSPWHNVMDALDLIRLPLFTALAGFLYGAMPATRDGFGAYMTRKIRQLLVPLVFATLVFWVLRELTYGENERSLFWAYVYGYQHLWYIDALLLIFAAVSFIDTKFSPTWKTWAGVVAAVVLTYWALPEIPIMHVKNAIFFLPFFIFGLLLYRVRDLLKSQALLGASVVAMLAIIALQQVFEPEYLALNVFGLLGWLGGAASVVALLRLFPSFAVLAAIAPYSFTIYLWHPAANGTVRNILWSAGVDSTWLLFLIGVAAGVLIPILMHLVLLRFPKAVSTPIIGG